MAKKEIKVTFKTITPLWTGDAWQNNSEIRPSSLIGSLRFWFEVICYSCDVLEKKDFNSQNGRFEKEVDRDKLKNFIQQKGNDTNEIIKYLIEEQNIPISSVIFGTTNWKSLIEIKSIEPIEDYCFGNRLNLPKKICIKKNTYEIKENNDCPNRFNNQWSVYFLSQPYFYGKFKVKFSVNKEIINSIFYPLLTFMNDYGFWGGKWNIGYGRLKIINLQIDDNEEHNWRKEEINLKEFCFRLENFKKVIVINDKTTKNDNKIYIIELINNFNELIQLDERNKKIKVLKNELSNNDPKELIEELMKIKAQERANFKGDKELRHKIFGTTNPPPHNKNLLPQGAKILPYICKEKNHLKGGFLSITSLLSLEGEIDG